MQDEIKKILDKGAEQIEGLDKNLKQSSTGITEPDKLAAIARITKKLEKAKQLEAKIK